MLALYICLAILTFLASVVIIRAFLFRPEKYSNTPIKAVIFDEKKAVNDLSEMVKCKTVSNVDKALEDDGEFERFKLLLKELFPLINSKCEYIDVGSRSILYKLDGLSSENPIVLMSHYDVVSVDGEKWKHPPFSGLITEEAVWGRGTLDTKGTLNACMQAVETLIEEGFVPEKDIYLAFGGDEEINGHGASDIVDYFEEHHIAPSYVLDEGGAVVEGVFPGVKAPCALVGIAEKGIMNVELVSMSNGGHSSSPPRFTPLQKLSRACCKITKKSFKYKPSVAATALFNTLSPHSSFLYRILFANLWLFSPLLSLYTKTVGGEMNALVRTTCAFTQAKGSDGMNVIPTEAKMVANLRINPGETTESVIEYLNSVINDSEVKVNMLYGTNPSRVSTTDSDGYKTIVDAIKGTWEGTLVSPYLMVACSDSRHWGRISDKVYRFSAMALVGAERGTIHGNNEHIPIDTVKKSVEFYLRLLKQI